MFTAFRPGKEGWWDLAALALALGYIGGFLAALELALARLVFLSTF